MDAILSGVSDPSVVIGRQGDQRRQLLYIEDNPSNLTLVKWILEREIDVDVISAMRGRSGVDLAHDRQPELIVLDLHLPDMSGEQVLECLQARPATRVIPVLVLSADTGGKRIARLLSLGVRDYLTKPLDIPHFLKVVTENLKPRT